jgi:RHS repeat-associated protein
VPTYNYNSSNELTSNSTGSYTYDANGNTLSDPSGKSYSWSFENQLTSVTLPGSGGTVSFRYDPFGRRIQKSGPLGTTNYLYDGNGDSILEETDNSGNVLARYAQSLGIDQTLAELRSTVASYYEQDGLSSVTSLSNSSTTLANTYTYDSFGRLTASTGTLTNPLQYTGRDFDQETGLGYYRTRYYNYSVGRFINEDPARFMGGSNFYPYVGNSPIRLADPYGLAPVDPADIALLLNLFPGAQYANGSMSVSLPCTEVTKILEQSSYYTSDNWPSWNPFLFWDPIAHSGGSEFRKPDGMHFRMVYPNKPCDQNCTLDEFHDDPHNPMYDPWGHFWYDFLPYVVSAFPPPGPHGR